MLRSVQFWEMTDPQKNPLAVRFPSQKFVALLNAQASAGTSLAHLHADGIESVLEAFPNSKRPHVCLHSVRRVNMPSEEQNGQILDLSIPPSNGLAEGTHFVFYPRNVVACVYNHHGPRIRRLGQWLEGRMGIKIDFRPIYRQDVLSVLDQFDKVTKVEVSLPAVYARSMQDANDDNFDVAGALRDAGDRVPGKGTVRMAFGSGRGNNPTERSWIRGFSRALASRTDIDPKHFGTAKVWGYLPGERTITALDLVEDQLIAQRNIEPESSRSRRLNSGSAVAACDSVYEQFTDQISATVDTIGDGYAPLPKDLLPIPDDAETNTDAES